MKPGIVLLGDLWTRFVESLQPVFHGLVIDLQIISQVGDRQQGTDLARQEIDEKLYKANFANVFEIPQVLTYNAREPVASPDASLIFRV